MAKIEYYNNNYQVKKAASDGMRFNMNTFVHTGSYTCECSESFCIRLKSKSSLETLIIYVECEKCKAKEKEAKGRNDEFLKYCIECIVDVDNENFDKYSDKGKVKFLMNAIRTELGREVWLNGSKSGFIEYCKGLGSYFNIAFEQSEVKKINDKFELDLNLNDGSNGFVSLIIKAHDELHAKFGRG